MFAVNYHSILAKTLSPGNLNNYTRDFLQVCTDDRSADCHFEYIPISPQDSIPRSHHDNHPLCPKPHCTYQDARHPEIQAT